MNASEEIRKLKSELAETREQLLKAQLEIMDLRCIIESTARRLTDILNKKRRKR